VDELFDLYGQADCFEAMDKILTVMHHCVTNTSFMGENPCSKQEKCFIHDNFFMNRTIKKICSCGAGNDSPPTHMD
jgi:hypothetical protein